jgi:hypothetical protein
MMLRMLSCKSALCGAVIVASSMFTVTVGAAQRSSTSGNLLQAQEVDVAGPRELIVGNLHGVYKTTDAGRLWISITPSTIAAQPILLSHVSKIVSIGDQRIWLELVGDARLDFTLYSSNGGMSWRKLDSTDSLPTTKKVVSAINPNGRVAKHFHILHSYYASPILGWAQAIGPPIGNFFPTYLLRTINRGRTWTTVST